MPVGIFNLPTRLKASHKDRRSQLSLPSFSFETLAQPLKQVGGKQSHLLRNECCQSLRLSIIYIFSDSYAYELSSEKGAFVSVLAPLVQLRDCIKRRQRVSGVNAPWPCRAVLQWTAVG